MSLFIGNISRTVTAKDLLAAFAKYGKSSVDIKGNFAFVDFESVRAAEQAKNVLHGKEFMGSILNIEWSHKSKRNSSSSSTSRLPAKAPVRSDVECYVCGEVGHLAKECKRQERQETGHSVAFDRSSVLESLRKERSRVRFRVKSPGRYSRLMNQTPNILRPS
jgi:RNA recognition motif-containing protein